MPPHTADDGKTDVYTEYHPRWLRRPVSTFWWLESWSYFAFILREVSCVFVAWFVVYLLWLVRAVAQGAPSYQEFLTWSARPGILVLNVISFAFLMLHAVTFFDAAPRAMVLHVGRNRVPARAVAASHYVAWAAASVVVCWILLGA
jgi:fumarate reductase subunit C